MSKARTHWRTWFRCRASRLFTVSEGPALATPTSWRTRCIAGSQPELAVYPKIANLSRRLQIVSADVVEGDTHHRAHTLIMEDGAATIRNVELRDLGPREKLGRYPVHFHHGGRSDDVLEGSSIWQDVTDPGNRFVAIHDVQGVRVANNVALSRRGHGFFMESGPEFDNQVIGNLSVEVTGNEELAGLESPVGATSHHFWLRGGNTIEGNVAAGGTAVGLVVFSAATPGTIHVSRMQSLGTKLYGMWSGAEGVVYDDPVAVYNTRAGFGAGRPTTRKSAARCSTTRSSCSTASPTVGDRRCFSTSAGTTSSMAAYWPASGRCTRTIYRR